MIQECKERRERRASREHWTTGGGEKGDFLVFFTQSLLSGINAVLFKRQACVKEGGRERGSEGAREGGREGRRESD